MFTGEENLLQVAESGSKLINIFEKNGLGSYFEEQNLNKIGKYLKINTLLRSRGIDASGFLALLNEADADTEEKVKKMIGEDAQLHLSSMLPCGLRNPFKEHFESVIQERQDEFAALNYLIEGNVNHELSYYPLLDSIENEAELPDVIMASDVNNFFHRPFMERFVEKGIFETYMPYQPNEYLEKVSYSDTHKNFTMITANMLVIVVDKEKLGDRKMPEKWSDLLDESFENSIVMRGEGDFFCNAVMLPFYKDHGFEAIKMMAKNIHSGMHPAQMVKMAESGEGVPIYLMPYFFAKRIKKKSSIEIIWPEDGAIASPVFMLVKKDKMEQHKALLDLIVGQDMGAVLIDRYFPSLYPGLSHDAFPQKVKWLGWDFIYNTDIGQLKDDIATTFNEVWLAKK